MKRIKIYTEDNISGMAIQLFISSINKNIDVLPFSESCNFKIENHTSSIIFFNLAKDNLSCYEKIKFINNNLLNPVDSVPVFIVDNVQSFPYYRLILFSKIIVIDLKSPLSDYQKILDGVYHRYIYIHTLTQRELIIFDLISSEYDCKKISSILDVNFKTVYSHRLKSVSKLKLKNTHDLYNFMVKLKADDELNFE